jgi:hypothetical protein
MWSGASLASLATQLLKHDAFCWMPVAVAAFEALKAAMNSTPVLQLPDFMRPFISDCDASSSGFGTILHQGGGLIAFFSEIVLPQHAKLAVYERELISLVKAIRH